MPTKTPEEINEQIQNAFKGIKSENYIVLLNTAAEYYFDSVMATASFMTKSGRNGVYVTACRPYAFIIRKMREDKRINTDNILFLDCISRMAGMTGVSQGTEDAKKCTFVDNPAALEEIKMYIGTLLDKLKGDKFLIIDSISTFLIYNTPGAVKEFSMLLTNTLRLLEVSGVLIIIEKEAPEDLTQILIAMTDKTIKVTDETIKI